MSGKDVYVVNEYGGNAGILLLQSYLSLNADSLNLSGYKVGICLYDKELGSSSNNSSVLRANQLRSFNISDVDYAIDVQNSSVTLNTENAVIQVKDGGKAFSLEREATVNFTSSDTANIVGDIKVSDSQFNMKRGKFSLLRGSALNEGTGTLAFELGEGSFWYLTAQSNLTCLSAQQATVVFNAIGGPDSSSLTVDALKGSNTNFVLAAAPGLSAVSFLSLGNDTEAGTHTVSLGADTSLADLGDIAVQFAHDASGNVTFEASSALVDAGLWVATPELELLSSENGGNDWYIRHVKQDEGPTPVAMIDGLQNNYFFWRSLNDSTRERFGQLRHGEATGVWGRATAGTLSYGSISSNYQTYRLGVDGAISPNFKKGIMVERHEGKLEGNGGKGDMEATTVALYGLYVFDNGFYVDGGLRFGIMDYDYVNRVEMADQYDYKSSAFRAWAEIGREFEVVDGVFVSPHAAFAYGRFSAENFETNNGLKASVDSVESAIFTLGADFGFKVDKLEVFFTAEGMHEALGDQTIQVSHEGSVLRQDVSYSDSWAEYGMSVSYRPSDNTLFWVNARRSAFSDVDRDWRLNAGFRWSFM